MEYLHTEIQKSIVAVLKNQAIYANVSEKDIVLQKTRKEFQGDLTLILFSLGAIFKQKPSEIGKIIGDLLQQNTNFLLSFEVVAGFLNLSFKDAFWQDVLNKLPFHFQALPASGKTYLVEYSSPNTNKPLHLGHLRNNFLGYSIAQILEFQGHRVVKTQIINDRGVHICKSMLAWQKWGHGETPESTGIKGDKFVGKYYVLFDKAYKAQIKEAIAQGITSEIAERQAPLMQEVQLMLLGWEKADKTIHELWQKMNQWVYQGFAETYQNIGVHFDQNYYESKTYLLGKNIVQEGLQKNVFYEKPDGAIACDLTADGLDEKIVQRKDGTAMYITQDLGTAVERFKDYPQMNGVIYVVASEQDYHFKVLLLILKKLGYAWADACYHLSYGMVELPTGKMKSREGTVVDADELIVEVKEKVEEQSEALGKLADASTEEKENLYHILAVGAIKYFLLRVDPKKKMLFDPQESVQLQGDTSLFVQYTYVRIQSILKKQTNLEAASQSSILTMTTLERNLIHLLSDFYVVVQDAANAHNPSLIVNYIFQLVSLFNSFYQALPILKEEQNEVRQFRIILSQKVAKVIEKSCELLGISLPKRM